MMRARAVWVAALVGLATGCGGEAASVPLLEEALRAHREALALAAAGDVAGAAAALERVVALPFPAGAEEAEDVRIDALAQAARLWLEAKDAVRAEAVARRATAAATRDSYFAGLAWLRLGDALRAQGRARDAVRAFERSIEINRATQDALLAREKNR